MRRSCRGEGAIVVILGVMSWSSPSSQTGPPQAADPFLNRVERVLKRPDSAFTVMPDAHCVGPFVYEDRPRRPRRPGRRRRRSSRRSSACYLSPSLRPPRRLAQRYFLRRVRRRGHQCPVGGSRLFITPEGEGLGRSMTSGVGGAYHIRVKIGLQPDIFTGGPMTTQPMSYPRLARRQECFNIHRRG